jgi:hypothetical protein
MELLSDQRDPHHVVKRSTDRETLCKKVSIVLRLRCSFRTNIRRRARFQADGLAEGTKLSRTVLESFL